ncbi:MAG: ATP-binding protein, partial [Longicatena sp.]
MIVRPHYLDILRIYRDVPLVKILAGIRRSGKSTILEMLRKELMETGISCDHIISMRYTSENFEDGMTSKEMYQGINEKITDDDRYYLLLDEVQEIDGWEKAVNALLEDVNTDIYVTGSNSKLMSSEISTYLTGRYISIPVYTLSFGEYLEFKKNSKFSKKELLNEYIRMGGFPIVASGDFDEKSSYQIVDGIYYSVITRDITKRHQVKNFELFNRVVKYVVENVGKTFSANAIVKFLKNEGRS